MHRYYRNVLNETVGDNFLFLVPREEEEDDAGVAKLLPRDKEPVTYARDVVPFLMDARTMEGGFKCTLVKDPKGEYVVAPPACPIPPPPLRGCLLISPRTPSPVPYPLCPVPVPDPGYPCRYVEIEEHPEDVDLEAIERAAEQLAEMEAMVENQLNVLGDLGAQALEKGMKAAGLDDFIEDAEEDARIDAEAAAYVAQEEHDKLATNYDALSGGGALTHLDIDIPGTSVYSSASARATLCFPHHLLATFCW